MYMNLVEVIEADVRSATEKAQTAYFIALTFARGVELLGDRILAELNHYPLSKDLQQNLQTLHQRIADGWLPLGIWIWHKDGAVDAGTCAPFNLDPAMTEYFNAAIHDITTNGFKAES